LIKDCLGANSNDITGALASIGFLYEHDDNSSEEDEKHNVTSFTEGYKRKIPDNSNPSKRICQKAEDDPQPKASHVPTETSPCLLTSKETRLPLPTELMEMFKEKALNEVEMVKSENHEGRVRGFPHERGNWATYVYIQFDSDKFCDDLEHLLTLSPELNRAKDFHISLSKTIVLRHHWIQPFVESLKLRLQHIKRFFLTYQALKFYTNEEKTRTFLGIQVDRGDSQLREIVEKIDECLREFKLTTFYEDPSFHVSIGWCVGDRQQELMKILPALQEKWLKYSEGGHSRPTKICNITCKTGNKTFHFPLTD